jgi:serine/threonine-protein kinase RsbT
MREQNPDVDAEYCVPVASVNDIVTARLQGTRRGVVVVARDRGPGIGDLKLAVRSGYSTSGGLGLGLPGVRRIVDDFQIVSNRQDGTTVTVTKWRI